MTRRGFGVALLSGGLDSALAVKALVVQGVRVVAVRCMTNFGCDAGGGGSCGHDVTGLAKELGVDVKLCHLGEPYVEMVRNPKFGRGFNMNPCVDCRVFMLRWAAEYMNAAGADFLVTGEVLNQRPFSQTRDRLMQVEKEVGLPGRILRPLSAKLLPPTIPEKEGLVDREQLFDIRGRSRKRQYELAKQWGVASYGQPAGGCLLTDPGYSERLRELWADDPGAGVADIQLLRVGRHFRLGPRVKAIVGRNEAENHSIEAQTRPGDVLLALRDLMGPTTLVRGAATAPHLRRAAELTARYGDAKALPEVDVEVRRGDAVTTLRVSPEAALDLDALRVAVK